MNWGRPIAVDIDHGGYPKLTSTFNTRSPNDPTHPGCQLSESDKVDNI